jgi:hypothetical protein
MKAGYDGYCERCAAHRSKPAPPKKASYRNKSLDAVREELSATAQVLYRLPPDEPRIAVSHEDYLEFLRRMQTRPMTEGEVADLVIRRLEQVATGKIDPDAAVYGVDELRKLSDAWLTEAQEKRIRSLVMQYASRWKSPAPSEV